MPAATFWKDLRQVAVGLCAVALWLSSASAAAQEACPGGVCAAGRCERGVCIPAACGDVEACFGPSFEEGDCDRDLVPNRTDGTLCAGIIITYDVQFAEAPLSTGGLSTLPSAGSTEVAPGVFSDVPNALAIGCTPLDRCPTLPGLASRCVFPYGGLQGGNLGLCSYGQDTRNDRTCIDFPSIPSSGCFAAVPPIGYSAWAQGDCDGDGLTNEQDPRVCGRLQVVAPAPGPDLELVCAPGVVTRPDRVACSTARELAPGIVGCAEVLPGVDPTSPFALCCSGQAECPVLADGTVPRCVRVPGTPARGVCTYGPGATPRDDFSCVAAGREPSAACFLGGPGEYDSWARGDCDGCLPSNGDDDAVCACPDADAGVDAGASDGDAGVEPIGDAGTDASIEPLVDAGTDASGFDAGRSGPGPSARADRHAGCGCTVGGRTLSGLSWGTLVALACGLGARFARKLRQRTKRGHSAAASRR